jgi:hypothetical protein
MERSAIRDCDHDETALDFAEPVIGRAFARPVGFIRATVLTAIAGTLSRVFVISRDLTFHSILSNTSK